MFCNKQSSHYVGKSTKMNLKLFFVAPKSAACNDGIGTVFALRLLFPREMELSDNWSVIISVVGAFSEPRLVVARLSVHCVPLSEWEIYTSSQSNVVISSEMNNFVCSTSSSGR